MIDYFSHKAVLDQLRTALAAATLTDPSMANERNRLLSDIASDPDATTLGAFIDHVITHASSDGNELNLLETAADIWKSGLDLYTQVSSCRASIEQALISPSDPASLSKFNAGTSGLSSLKLAANQIVAETQALQASIDTLAYLKAHPRQSDTPIQDWDWGNLFLARRTDAFVRATFARSRDSRSRAFAFGVLASYGANVAGSAFLDHVVGGPRRTHRFRDRLARNAVGAWVKSNSSLPSLLELSKQLRFDGVSATSTLPAGIATTLEAALQEAFPMPGVSLPDLDLGLQRTIRHLELLSGFERPPFPTPPDPALGPLLSTLQPGDAGGGLHATSDPPGTNDDPSPGPPTSDPSTSDSKSTSGSGCLVLLVAAIVFALVFVIDCIVQLIEDGKCDPGKTWKAIAGGGDGGGTESDPTAANASQLTTIATSPAGAHLVQQLYEFQLNLCQAFSSSFSYLAITGLIYPDDLLIPLPVYSQFTSIPSYPNWPRRSEAKPADTYHLYPTSSLEQPTTIASPFPIGAQPAAFISGTPGVVHPTAVSVALPLWEQVAGRGRDSANLDLDADRGFRHSAWEVAHGTSISDDPLSVSILAYGSI